MAVLARATITLAQTVDITSVTWYYKLQASTLAPPAKPTTDPPTGGWVTTEPTYTEGSTNSLYVCEKTSFTDGGFDYSDVSLSSSYEAAKAAYNKSVQALDTAEEALDTAEEAQTMATDYITDISGGGVFVHPDGDTDNGVKITDSIEIMNDGDSVAEYGSSARVGKSDGSHIIIGNSGLKVYGGGASSIFQIADLGYTEEPMGEDVTFYEPYFTLGVRTAESDIGNQSVAEGSDLTASGDYSYASGIGCIASATASHAEGSGSEATGSYSHAEGRKAKATGLYAHAEGFETTASGEASHAGGDSCTAGGDGSFAHGIENSAPYEAQTVFGKYASAPASDDLMLVGNGSSASNRSNAMRLKSSGRVEFAGAVGSGLSWTTRTEMVNAMTGLSLGRPYSFYAGSTWTSTAGAGSADAFGVICKTTTTQWQMLFMSGGNVYKSIFNSSTLAFSTTKIG